MSARRTAQVTAQALLQLSCQPGSFLVPSAARMFFSYELLTKGGKFAPLWCAAAPLASLAPLSLAPLSLAPLSLAPLSLSL